MIQVAVLGDLVICALLYPTHLSPWGELWVEC